MRYRSQGVRVRRRARGRGSRADARPAPPLLLPLPVSLLYTSLLYTTSGARSCLRVAQSHAPVREAPAKQHRSFISGSGAQRASLPARRRNRHRTVPRRALLPTPSGPSPAAAAPPPAPPPAIASPPTMPPSAPSAACSASPRALPRLPAATTSARSACPAGYFGRSCRHRGGGRPRRPGSRRHVAPPSHSGRHSTRGGLRRGRLRRDGRCRGVTRPR
jgi:hypothetical protein